MFFFTISSMSATEKASTTLGSLFLMPAWVHAWDGVGKEQACPLGLSVMGSVGEGGDRQGLYCFWGPKPVMCLSVMGSGSVGTSRVVKVVRDPTTTHARTDAPGLTTTFLPPEPPVRIMKRVVATATTTATATSFPVKVLKSSSGMVLVVVVCVWFGMMEGVIGPVSGGRAGSMIAVCAGQNVDKL